MDEMEEKALRMGAVALVRLRKPDLEAAVVTPHIRMPVGEIVRFPKRPKVSPPEPAIFEDPRWAELHRPD